MDAFDALAVLVVIADELEQGTVGIAEVHADTVAARSGPLHGAELDGDTVCAQVLDRARDRPVPAEAEVAVPRLDPHSRHGLRGGAGHVHVQLLNAEAIRVTPAGKLQYFRTEHVAVEGVRPRGIRDGEDRVVERESGSWG